MLGEGADGTDAGIDEWRHNLIADADAARRFLDDTDFGSETVYVERHVVGECYDHRLCWIRRTDGRFDNPPDDVRVSSASRDAIGYALVSALCGALPSAAETVAGALRE